MTTPSLNGKTIAVLATDGFEQVELTQPVAALKAAGASVHIVSPKPGVIQGFKHHDKGDTTPVDKTLEDASPEDYDGLLLPGGVINPDALRLEEAAIAFIRARPKPLALYAFTSDRALRQRFIDGTSSGALVFDFAVAHLTAPDMPFGGIGNSGMGAYHGEASFRIFSHFKPVMTKPLWPDTLRLIFPPYGKTVERVIDWLLVRG